MEINFYGQRSTCGVLSPDGRYGCMKKANHKSTACNNPAGGVIWCGDCMAWSCEHVSPPEIPKAFTDAMEGDDGS